MGRILTAIILLAIPMQANATPVGAPEIDGALALQAIALAGGIALLLRKKHRG
jgi:hypothetical protein